MILNWLTDWKFWGALIEAIFILILTYSAWWRRRDIFVKGEIKEGDTALSKQLIELDHTSRDKFSRVHFRIDEMSQHHAAHGQRLTRLESIMRSLPSHNDIGVLHKKMGTMQKEVTAALTVANQTNDLVKTINSYLIQREDK